MTADINAQWHKELLETKITQVHMGCEKPLQEIGSWLCRLDKYFKDNGFTMSHKEIMDTCGKFFVGFAKSHFSLDDWHYELVMFLKDGDPYNVKQIRWMMAEIENTITN